MEIIYPIIYMILILIYSSLPDTQNLINTELSFGPIINNFLHIPAYALLTLLWFISFHKRFNTKNKSIFYASFTAFAFGIFAESIQLIIPSRFASLTDIFRNSIGISLAAFLIWIVQKFQIIKIFSHKIIR